MVKSGFTGLTWPRRRTEARAMNGLDPDHLQPAFRLALAYAPARARAATGALLALDTRLALIGRQAREPLITQMKLAWWRDQFAQPAGDWPGGEPLLAALAEAGIAREGLSALVDGWEALLLSEEPDAAAAISLAQGRAAAWCALGHRLEVNDVSAAIAVAAERWSMAELAEMLAQPMPQPAIQEQVSVGQARLPRALRPLAVLDALAHRALRRSAPMLDGPGALALAMRVGIFGR